jgi:predicted PurR-regulated permease PerM
MMVPKRRTLIFLACLTAVAVVFCFLLLAPFLKAIVFAAVLAIIFYPLYIQVRRRSRNRSVAAAVSTTIVAVFIASVSVSLGTSITSGLRNIYRSLSDPAGVANTLTNYLSHAIERFVALVSGYVPVSVADLHGALSTQAENIVSNLLALTARMAGGIASLVVNAAISLFILFFLFRDGRSLLRRIAVFLPMERTQVSRLYETVRQTLNAIVYGTLVIAALQGALTGIAFWFVGITSAGLWGVVTALCALLPIIGTGFVFTPAILFLVLGGHWVKGLLLGVWALTAVHPVDNLLRPYLIGEKAKLSTLYVFFALLGGFEAFGGLGLFVGPLILAVTFALFAFLRQELKLWKQRERANLHPVMRATPKRAGSG